MQRVHYVLMVVGTVFTVLGGVCFDMNWTATGWACLALGFIYFFTTAVVAVET